MATNSDVPIYEQIFENFKDSSCKCCVLDSEGSLAQIEKYIENPEETLVALDFDQTLKIPKTITNPNISVRGQQESVNSLEKLAKQNVTFVIITAIQPRKESLKSIVTELKELNLDSLFSVSDFDISGLFDYIRSWGPNHLLSLKKLRKKLLCLLVLVTDRYVQDLHRIGRSTTILEKDEHQNYSKVCYRLKDKDHNWQALLTLNCNKEDPLICPVECFSMYYEKTSEYDSNWAPDQLFLNFQRKIKPEKKRKFENQNKHNEKTLEIEEPDLVFDALTQDQISNIVYKTFRKSNCCQNLKEKEKILGVCVDNCQIVQIGPDKVEIGIWNDSIIGSRYNKAEALDWFQKKNPKQFKKVIFVDDNSDNCLNVFGTFSGLNKEDSNAPNLISCWFPPPAGGKEENHDQDFQKAFLKLSEIN